MNNIYFIKIKPPGHTAINQAYKMLRLISFLHNRTEQVPYLAILAIGMEAYFKDRKKLK